ncbi:acyl carrier protein [Longirhabdus pacifica]|uniref:acyl carrier protein n=1 Tax=Longirhabdus pacifica TaxID=2305227 RepID=UPI00100911F7|nr:phosphopantetheine-binding protein [Longirhabdus pacifica]
MNRAQLESKVIQCIEDIIPSNVQIDHNTDLLKVGINSMTFIRLVVSLEDAFDIEIEDQSIYLDHFSKVTSICDLLEALIAK